MKYNKYKVVIAQSGKMDIVQKKKYILQHFQYREYAENFSHKIKKAIKELEIFPAGYKHSGFHYRGYDIYVKSKSGCLLFYTINELTRVVTVLRVLQDHMDWQYIMKRWIQDHS